MSKTNHTPSGAAPLLVTANQAASMCGRSVRTWRAWDSSGRIPSPIRIGSSTLWRAAELQAWVEAGCPSREEWESLQGEARPR
jgi:predicted DNA-binding transcriptional regulator AlpA